jgi:hypothetical protein
MEQHIETRAEEVARVRSYLAAQAMKRTIPQLIETLQESRSQFNAVIATISDEDFYKTAIENEWSAAEVLEHVRIIAQRDIETICFVLENGETPVLFPYDFAHPDPANATKQALLQAIEDLREQLIATVIKADPEAHLNITWKHSEFGEMHWREWFLFARVHTLDHVRQLQKISNAL